MTRTTVVFGAGAVPARLVVVGEAPGATEDGSGRPFDGRSGRLLDAALSAAGTSRDHVYVCNAVQCRPPQNRRPSATEIASCARFLSVQLAATSPATIVALGKSACAALDLRVPTLAAVRGVAQRIDTAAGPRWCVPTVHPAYVLRRRSEWEHFVADLTAALAWSPPVQ